jgi:hypothetical protein
MNPFISFPHIGERPFSGSDFAIQGNGKLSKDSSLSEQVFLISIRSPGDHLHLVAIKPWHSKELVRAEWS